MMWTDGVLMTDTGEVVARPGLTIEQLRATEIGRGIGATPTGPDWEYVRIGPILVHGHEFNALAYFYRGQLGRFTLGLSAGEQVALFGTDKVAGPEDAETKFYEGIVSREFGGQTRFAWGQVFGGYERVSNYAELSFIYDVGSSR